ncbi:hypothetical protein TR13x_04580 [Caloranaerobacter sp. TR13]|nr:hypothetical protein TR13x_04580 [Caloranaerobacter sp. TR13]
MVLMVCSSQRSSCLCKKTTIRNGFIPEQNTCTNGILRILEEGRCKSKDNPVMKVWGNAPLLLGTSIIAKKGHTLK